jgi:hypothetical protein
MLNCLEERENFVWWLKLFVMDSFDTKGTKWILRRLKHVGIFMIYFRTNIDIMEGIILDLQPAGEVVKRDNFSVLRFMTKSFVYSRNLCTKLMYTLHAPDSNWSNMNSAEWTEGEEERKIHLWMSKTQFVTRPPSTRTDLTDTHSGKKCKSFNFNCIWNFFSLSRLSVKWTTDHLQFLFHSVGGMRKKSVNCK